MSAGTYNLAIETATPPGSITLGLDDEILGTCDLPQLTRPRHGVDLVPTIDELCRGHGVTATQIRQIYVSIGPGSFTGLRIAIATVKTLAQIINMDIVAIPTLDAVAQNAPDPSSDRAEPHATAHLAVCLASKRDTVYGGVYQWADDHWQPITKPGVLKLADLIANAGQIPYLLGDPLPELDRSLESVVVALPGNLAVARSEVVWRMGRRAAAEGRFTEPGTLAPLYARPPEAVELWDKRQATTQSHAQK